jgi:potassium efflux system protein
MLVHVWTAIVVWHLFGYPDKILAPLDRDRANQPVSNKRNLTYALIFAAPLLLVIMAWRGYLTTACELSVGWLATAGLCLCGVTLYWMGVRWFALKKRRLALAEAIARRRERREAADSDAQGAAGEVVSIDVEDDRELDLDSISVQTRQLLRLLFGLGVGTAVLAFWSGNIPLLAVMDRVSLPGGYSLLDFAKAVLIVGITWIAARDLPGLLELSVLRSTSIETGARYAISTLCQYALIAVGALALFQVLNVDWTKFGWIAAALSVGLGFGLQEVVANFVCGLLLLFEQPVRVGDVVTVENVTGTVTRIRMRATTITNWDRQELMVPNKALITNSVLNWTLTATTNRVVISVGVAYGSNTDEATQILLDVAAAHPLILEEPAPLASFEGFADSSLTLVLRAYLPSLDNRLKTITELHAEIDKRFAEAGIEIAFPQRDLHLRSGFGAAVSQDVAGEGRDRCSE